jgi:hypothetical protein
MGYRIEVLHEDKGLAFGKDNACGDFLQIWIRPANPEERKTQDQFGPEDLIVDEDTVFTCLTGEIMEKIVVEHGFTMEELEEASRYRR